MTTFNNTNKVVTYKETYSAWSKSRRSARLKSKTKQNLTNKIKPFLSLLSQKKKINKSTETL